MQPRQLTVSYDQVVVCVLLRVTVVIFVGSSYFLFFFFFFFNDTATTEIYTNLITLSLHDALPISFAWSFSWAGPGSTSDTTGRFGSSPRRKRSEEHTSELQSHSETSYAVYCS